LFKLVSEFHDQVLTYRDLLALLLLPCALMAWIKQSPRLVAATREISHYSVGLATLIITFIAWTSVRYLVMPGYFDHVEASVAAISWWHKQGHPLYPVWTDGEGVYGLLYGPLLYQITGAAPCVSPTILMSKIPGFLSFWIAGFAIFSALRPSGRLALLALAVCLTIEASHPFIVHWIRADPYLLLFASLALLAERRLKPDAAAVAIGVLAGATINLKIHGLLYLVPYAVALLAKCRNGRQLARTAAVGILSLLTTIALPFLDPNISISGYIAYIRIALRQEIDGPLLMANLRFAGVLITPFLILAWRHLRGDSQPDLPMGVAFVMSLAIMCILAGKQLGAHHLLPFLPCFACLLARAVQVKPRGEQGHAPEDGLAICSLVLLICYMPGIAMSLNDVRIAEGNMEKERGALAELSGLYQAFPRSVMGVSDNNSYRLTYYRIVGIVAGAPVGIEIPAWIDLKLGGVPEEPVERLLANCSTPFWIIPNGETIFGVREPTEGNLVFSDHFRQRFLEEYKVLHDGVHYSVWACRDNRARSSDARVPDPDGSDIIWKLR
jgi:hypothetical protein